jgi:hypothetical protein
VVTFVSLALQAVLPPLLRSLRELNAGFFQDRNQSLAGFEPTPDRVVSLPIASLPIVGLDTPRALGQIVLRPADQRPRDHSVLALLADGDTLFEIFRIVVRIELGCAHIRLRDL